MEAVLQKLRAIFSDGPAEMFASAMAELGFVPKAQMEGKIALPLANLDVIAAGLGIKAEQLTGDIKVYFAAIRSGIKKEAETEITARATAILETCSLAGMEKMAIELITSGTDVQEARTKVFDAKANGATRSKIRSTVNPMNDGEVNPLLEDAHKRAATATAQAKKQ